MEKITRVVKKITYRFQSHIGSNHIPAFALCFPFLPFHRDVAGVDIDYLRCGEATVHVTAPVNIVVGE